MRSAKPCELLGYGIERVRHLAPDNLAISLTLAYPFGEGTHRAWTLSIFTILTRLQIN